ncbi:hypothetical protein TSAR_008484 [Trichomalopsis sarcophagae]|uniref:Uncharacterized protein n=1 Tax=Trichomalopsis sarcophagae TaxID=543379 RepID=A0A232EZM9_9HYME|nr:hypothetical protein TSAR_008484 [Trichomalopsis sarcophagae]
MNHSPTLLHYPSRNNPPADLPSSHPLPP